MADGRDDSDRASMFPLVMKMSGEMFEGKDYPTQWALNPSAYQNMSNDQVDWAALAQQWIKMKETVVPPAPPPPNIGPNQVGDGGGGEAPMDMDTKEDDVPQAPPAPGISGTEAWNQWNQWGQWNSSSSGLSPWEWGGVPPPGSQDGKPVVVPAAVPAVPPAPTISIAPGFSVPPPSAPSSYSYNTVSPSQGYNQVPGYWTGEQSSGMTDSQQATPFMKGARHSSRVPHMRNTDGMRGRDERDKTPEEDTSTTIDAAKRRQLPAWIREGLEKMEREKQKAVERERQDILRKQELEARKLAEEEARAVLNPAKSKFDSDSEEEPEAESELGFNVTEREAERETEKSPEVVVRPRRSRFRDAGSPDQRISTDSSPHSAPVSVPAPPPPFKRSREEVLQDVMLKVRRSLTEILLEVTNEEISSVCREVWSRARAKAPAGQPPIASLNNSAPLAQITRKLGLGIYGASDSESEEDQSDSDQNQEMDSDEELVQLKEVYKQRQQAFKKVEEEIEAQLAKEEEEELQQRENDNLRKQLDDNHTGNTSGKVSVDAKETVNNQREASETLSSGGQTPQQQSVTTDTAKAGSSPASRSAGSESTSGESSSSNSSRSSLKTSRKSNKDSGRDRRRKKGSKSRSKSRSRSPDDHRHRSRSRSHSKSVKRHRSRSSSYSRSGKKHRSRSWERKRLRSRSKDKKRSRSRSRNRRRSRSQSYSRGKKRSVSRERRRSRSRSRDRRRRSRTRSRERRRSRSRSRDRRRSRSYSSRSKRRSRSRSRDKRRSRSKSRYSTHRDGKKSSRRYRE